jgi:hypothetical protein
MKKEEKTGIKVEHYWEGKLIKTEEFNTLEEWERELRKRRRDWERGWLVCGCLAVVIGIGLGLCGIIFLK